MKHISFASFLILFAVFSKSFTQDLVQSLTEEAEECGSTISDEGLRILTNETSKILIVINVTSPEVALVIDAMYHYYALWNGTNGDTIIIDIPDKNGTLLTPINSLMIPTQFLQYEEDWLRALPSLKALVLQSNGGREFELSNIPPDIMQMINSMIKQLVGCVPVTGQTFMQLTTVIDTISSQLTGPLNGILSEVQGSVPVPGNLMQILGTISGLSEVFSQTEGGFGSVQNSGVNLNLPELVQSSNAIDLLTNLLKQIGAVLDPSVLLAPIFATVGSLLGLVAAIGGALFAIVGGVINLVIQVVVGVLGLVIGLITAILGLGIDILGALAALGINILSLPIQLLNMILKLLSPASQQQLLSGLQNLFKTIAPFERGSPETLPGMDKALECLEGVSNGNGTNVNVVNVNYSHNRIDNSYNLLNFLGL